MTSAGAFIIRSSAFWFIGKRIDLADVGLVGEQHDDAVDARAPSRRAAARRT